MDKQLVFYEYRDYLAREFLNLVHEKEDLVETMNDILTSSESDAVTLNRIEGFLKEYYNGKIIRT